MAESVDTHDPRRLGDFIRDRRSQILAAWEGVVRTMRPAQRLSTPVLLDHIPEFLRQLADFVGELREGHDLSAPQEFPSIHALERLDQGYDLTDVVAEYGALRNCIVSLVMREGSPAMRSMEMPRLHDAIDRAIATSVTRYSHARERTLKALDRITTAALGVHEIEAFLPRTLGVLMETTASVDSVSVLLIESDVLRVKAAVGLAVGPGDAVPLRRGEGVAGRIWDTGKPLLVRDAAHDDRVNGSIVRKSATRGLYGVPIEFGSEIIGVALMGSATAHDFSHEDLLLFRTAVARAATLIAHARLDAERARLQREHEAERARLAAMLQVLPVGVVLAQAPSGRLVLANARMEELWGRPVNSDTVERYGDFEGYWTDGRRVEPHEWPISRALEKGETVEAQEIHVVAADGARRVSEHAAAPVRDAQGNIVAAVVTAVDVTERKQTEEELRQALAFREQIMSILGHDLRQPLQVIATSAALLKRNPDRPEVIERQLRNVQRIDDMIRDLLDYTRARQGTGIPLRRRRESLLKVLQQAIESIEALHPDRKISLEAPADASGEWDPDRLAQVFGNLLGNAATYSPPRSAISVRLRADGSDAVVEVHNEGSPIPEKSLPHVFEPFRRATTTASGTGLGLGLFIVRAIVEAHGGKVSVVSWPDDGTTFTVRLPK